MDGKNAASKKNKVYASAVELLPQALVGRKESRNRRTISVSAVV
jgi:hypothetical protein